MWNVFIGFLGMFWWDFILSCIEEKLFWCYVFFVIDFFGVGCKEGSYDFKCKF